MLPLPLVNIDRSGSQSLATLPDQETLADRLAKMYLGDPEPIGEPDATPLAKRKCSTPVADQAAHCSPANWELLGGKGMFLQRMKAAGVSVPPFQCVTTRVTNALEQHPLDSQRLEPYFPGIGDEPEAEISLAKIRERLNALLPSEQTRRECWLAGLAKFIASDDFYEQVKDSEAARHIRDHGLSTSGPLIVRSSGINEDNYGDAQAGKYLSEVQGDEDILRTCLKVMASAYRPEVCSEGIPQPMALIIQECINCLQGGVATSFQSFDDDTLRVEYTHGQPRGVVAGQSGNTPHRIDISRKEGAENVQYFPGKISSHFILHKNTDNCGYSEIRIDDGDALSDDDGQKFSNGHILSNDIISKLKDVVAKLEDLLHCPVDVEFAIDHQGGLFVLQVRPITQLSGDMVFTMPMPEHSLASGEGISEGYCTGPLWLAKKQQAGFMPEGAILVARHAEDWMLTSKCLDRAGGVVFASGAFNDHMAILMRQKKIPFMLAGEAFTTLAERDGHQATLACARFKGESGAFIVAGDMSEKLASHRSLSSAVADLPSVKAIPLRDDLSPPEGTFRQVTSGFEWLTDQNARLLAFFAPGRGLDCLANPIKLSMSPRRSELLAETSDKINQLIHGADALLEGYRAFLNLAGDKDLQKVQPLLNELQLLINRFATLKETILSGLKTIIRSLQSDEKEQLSTGAFRQWVANCHQLQFSLQALNPRETEQVRSVHELIFALHQRFVEALAPVALASGQGRISTENKITYVDCTTPGAEAPLLRPCDKTSIQRSGRRGTVLSMNDALIVNLKLGYHVAVIELFRDAEGGKGHTLRLKFSDRFDKPDGSDNPGALKRMWFLVQLLKMIGLNKEGETMKVSFNAIAGDMIVECARMASPETMQEGFEKLLTALRASRDMDLYLADSAIFERDEVEQWNFNMLAQRLDSDAVTETDRFSFQHILFLIAGDLYREDRTTPVFYHLLSHHQQQFIDQCRELVFSAPVEVLMSDEMGENIRRELLHHLLLSHPQEVIWFVEDEYPNLRNDYFIIDPAYSYELRFSVSPGQLFPGGREEIKKNLLKHGLKYASRRVRDDRELVLATVKVHPGDLTYASEELRNDRKIVMSVVTQYGIGLAYAGEEMQDDDEVVMTAFASHPKAFRFASWRIRSDINIIKRVIADDINRLSWATDTILSDRKSMLALIKDNALAVKYAYKELLRERAFIEVAIRKNAEVQRYVEKPAS
ncbi:PEP/pyruvate-binding domain-containing protein [Endozoicomonas sp. ALB032]|uniref:PEP/pyruvate-binding domain-containing protein n=1 Tax=Endozoicomonas sp. ALB032 TaxID=3403082 RepID=UPI003BB55054